MKILFTRFPLESRLGGAEIQTLSLMEGLSKKGHAVAFLGSCPTLLEETGKRHLLNAHLEIGPPPVTKLGTLSFFWRKQEMRRRLEVALNEFGKLDAIVMLSMSEKLLLTEAALSKGIKVFWVEHDRVGRWLTKNPWLPTLRKLSQRVTTICVSELSRKIYLDLGWNAERMIAIPNGIDLERFSGPGRGPEAGPELKVGCIARLSQEKGVDVLIQAAATMPEVDLTIVGEGPEEGLLRKMIDGIRTRELQTHDRIRIMHNADDLAMFYRSMDVIVLPSRDNDPFGLVIAEAMACGTPTVVTDQCGIAGYLRDGEDTIVVHSGLDRALKDALTRLMTSSLRRRISENALSTVKRLFSLEAMVGGYEGVFMTEPILRS